MNIDVRHGPSYAMAYCYLAVGEVLRAERGAMVAMSGGINVQADAGPGGVVKGLLRKALVNESLIMTRFTSGTHGAWVALASKFPGDIATVELDDSNGGIVAEAGSLLGLGGDVSADPRWAGLQMIAMREGATMLRIKGHGHALLAAYGGIETFDIAEGQSFIFDSGHVVAFSASMRVSVGPLGGVATAALSGEGIVAQIEGPGRVWIQTRSVVELGKWLAPNKNGAR